MYYRSYLQITQRYKSESFYRVVKSATDILNQKAYLISIISNNDYSRKIPKFHNASVGQHIRHSLDHYDKVLGEGLNDNQFCINYDERDRDTLVETDKTKALEKIDILIEKINLEVLF
jgi:hypothetical protein